MASLSKEVTHSGAKITLRQVETNEEVSCELDVDPNAVVNHQGGEVLQGASFGFVQNCVETDDTLTEEQRKKLRFEPESTEEDAEEDDTPPIMKIVEKLHEYANEAETKVRKDQGLKELIKKFLSGCMVKKSTSNEGGDDEPDAGQLSIDFGMVWSQLQEVFRIFLKDLQKPDVDAITVLVQLGTALGLCWYLIKHIAITYIETTTFKDIAYITCKVIGFLFRHLLAIQFGKILDKIGGWNSLLSATAVDHGTNAVISFSERYIPPEYLFIAIGVASLAIGAGLLGFRFLKR